MVAAVPLEPIRSSGRLVRLRLGRIVLGEDWGAAKMLLSSVWACRSMRDRRRQRSPPGPCAAHGTASRAGLGLQPFARRRAQALDGVVDVLTVSPSAATTVSSAPSSMRRPSLSTATCWVSFIFSGAFVQRLFGPGSQQPRSLTGKTGALRCKLQAGGETGNVPAAEIGHRHAEMSQHQAGAGADDDGHACDHGRRRERDCP